MLVQVPPFRHGDDWHASDVVELDVDVGAVEGVVVANVVVVVDV